MDATLSPFDLKIETFLLMFHGNGNYVIDSSQGTKWEANNSHNYGNLYKLLHSSFFSMIFDLGGCDRLRKEKK